MKLYLTTLVALSLFCSVSKAQYQSPLKIPIYLSGNFGELRNNHFHSGIDLKTQGVINKPVYNIADGYVSRISVSSSGYGLALYVTHPATGHVSVYAHLESYAPNIEAYVKQKQYEQESYVVNLHLKEGEIPVKQGSLIAYSGNTGSSGGPHVHFEIRDAVSEYVLDPLAFFKSHIKDNVAPDIRGIAAYPVSGEGVINGSRIPLRQDISKTKSGTYTALKTPIKAWGKIGLGIKAYDKMTSTTNIYGVKIVRLFVDNEKIFESDIKSYSFDQTRMLNTFVDFKDWRNRKSFFMCSFIEPGNKLPFYTAQNNGYIDINEPRLYNIRYELEDIYGNVSQYKFSISGVQQAIPRPPRGTYMNWDSDNYFENETFSLIIPKGNLYDDFIFNLTQTPSDLYFSDKYKVNSAHIPFDDKAEMKIKLEKDNLPNKAQYGLVIVNGNRESWVGGQYQSGWITTTIHEAGYEYAVSSDTEAPTITSIAAEKWVQQKKIILKVTDNKSGINQYKGMIDGEFALFEHDAKSPQYIYRFDPSKLQSGQTHKLQFVATDRCGNTSKYITEFYY